jgi:uncharacterized protein DUF488
MPRSQRAHQVGTARAKVKAAESLEESGPRLKVAPVVLTIGHSTRSLEEFITLLTTHRVTRVVDVRTVPRSRRNPQFNKTSLPESLEKAGLGYVHLSGLGGLRHASPDSINLGWRNASFRGYAPSVVSLRCCVVYISQAGTRRFLVELFRRVLFFLLHPLGLVASNTLCRG